MRWRVSTLLFLTFGLMSLMIGGMLGGMCLIADGIICEGTIIGSLGTTFFLIGVGLLVIAVVLAKVLPEPAPRQVSPFIAAAIRARAAAAAAPAAPVQRVASECPKCGGPVKPTDHVCEWCDTPLV